MIVVAYTTANKTLLVSRDTEAAAQRTANLLAENPRVSSCWFLNRAEADRMVARAEAAWK